MTIRDKARESLTFSGISITTGWWTRCGIGRRLTGEENVGRRAGSIYRKLTEVLQMSVSATIRFTMFAPNRSTRQVTRVFERTYLTAKGSGPGSCCSLIEPSSLSVRTRTPIGTAFSKSQKSAPSKLSAGILSTSFVSCRKRMIQKSKTL